MGLRMGNGGMRMKNGNEGYQHTEEIKELAVINVTGLLHNHLICCLGNLQGTCNLGCPTSIHNPVVPDQIADHTEGIVQAPFCLLNNLWRVGTDTPVDTGQTAIHTQNTVDCSCV